MFIHESEGSFLSNITMIFKVVVYLRFIKNFNL